MMRVVPFLLLASTSALTTPPASKLTTRPERSASMPLGVRVAAAVGTASALLPARALAAEDGGWSLPSLPVLPALTWLDSKEAHELGIFFAQTVISWGVPVAAIGALALVLRPSGNGDGGSRPLPPALAKALGMTNEPKEFLEIERLNEKLTSFEFSFRKAETSAGSALRVKTKADIERQLGKEFQSFGLDALTVDTVFKAAATYRGAEEKVTKRLEALQIKLRALTLTPTAVPSPSGKEALAGKVVPTGAAAKAAPAAVVTTAAAATAGGATAAPKRSVVDAILYGQKGPPSPEAAAGGSGEAASGMSFGMGGGAAGALKPLLKEKAALEEQQTQLELTFLRQLSAILTADQAAALGSVIKPAAELGGPSITGAPTGGPTRLDALGALVSAAAAASGRAKHVYVLKFFGDVTASQVAQLRQEVTAVLQTADAAGRGDEVVLVLNTGGGTVTGYGLAAAQLSRLKASGLPLTICVEQVAASGGYLMACVADRIVAAPFAVLGSIGVITEIPNVYERLTKEGISCTPSPGEPGDLATCSTPPPQLRPLPPAVSSSPVRARVWCSLDRYGGQVQAHPHADEEDRGGGPQEDQGRHRGRALALQEVRRDQPAAGGH